MTLLLTLLQAWQGAGYGRAFMVAPRVQADVLGSVCTVTLSLFILTVPVLSVVLLFACYSPLHTFGIDGPSSEW